MYQAATLSTPQLPLNKYTNGRRYMATLSLKL
jgi:hypothetical protein